MASRICSSSPRLKVEPFLVANREPLQKKWRRNVDRRDIRSCSNYLQKSCSESCNRVVTRRKPFPRRDSAGKIRVFVCKSFHGGGPDYCTVRRHSVG